MGVRRRSSVSEAFTLSPLPYPVFIIFILVLSLLAIPWSFSFESSVETVQEQMSWVLMATPIVLLIALRWLSSVENPDCFYGFSSSNQYRRRTYNRPAEGSSPWGVAALLLILLLMISYQSTFHDRWFP